MNLQKLTLAFNAFRSHLSGQKLSDFDWLYQNQFNSESFISINTDNINAWLNTVLTSSTTHRIWKSESSRAQELIMALAEFDRDMVATAFHDLFEESRDLEGRVDRFKYYMDELLSRFRRSQLGIKESWHHQNNSIISYYLCMRFPKKYTFYTRALHELIVNVSGAKPLGQQEDLIRFQKMTNTVFILMAKDSDLIKYHLQRFSKSIADDSRLLILEFLYYHADSNMDVLTYG